MKRISIHTLENVLFNGNDKTKKIIYDTMIFELWENNAANKYIERMNKKGLTVINLSKNIYYNLVTLQKGITIAKEL